MFLQKVSEGLGNHSKMMDELSIIAGQAEETTKFFGVGWNRPANNGSHFIRICRNTMSTDNVSQISKFLLAKGAFR